MIHTTAVSKGKLYCLFALYLLTSFFTQAQQIQNYPVQTTAYFAAPFSQRLSDYFSSDKRLLVDLLLKDLTKSSIQVYLKWSIEGVGIRVQSRDTYLPPSFITLQRGVVNRLRGSDLQANYFNPGAIETQGIDPRSVYAIELPEGFYTLKVQAFEAATGQVVSNVSETYMVLAYPQPPILNLPLVGSEVPVTSLQKVPLSWAPRHFASPTTQAVYHLQVCEVPDEFDPTELVMLTCTEPRLDVTVPTTSYAGDITQWIKPLEVGKRYAVQVTVSDLSGELTNFVNQGRSQVSWFRYGKECVPPAFSIQSLGTDRVQLSWQRTEGAQGYVVEYKLATAANWQTMLVSGTSQVVGSLNPTADYLFRMRSDCGGSAPSAASEIQSWNIRDEAPAVAPELPLALTNPLAIRVQTGVDGQLQVPTSLSALYSNYPRAVQPGAIQPGAIQPGAIQPGTVQSGPGGNTDPTSSTATNGSSSTNVTPTQGATNDPGSTTGSVATSAQPGSSTSSTGTTPTGTGLPLLTLPYCAMQASSFAGCELPHPTVGLPTGDRELSSLSVGDVLGIYDYAVFVTKVGGGSPLSGEGLARLPFLNGTMVLVEFSGVNAKEGEPGTNGGCVYAVPASGYFRIKRATQAEVLAAQRSLIASLVSKTSTDSSKELPFVGTLGEALAKYDSVVVRLGHPQSQTLSVATRQSLVQYTAAIAQGSESIKNSFDAVYEGSRDLLVISIRDSLAVLMSQVNQALTALQSGSTVSGLLVLTARYEALFAKLNQLTNPTTSTPATPNISPVVVSGLTDSSVKLSWQGDPSFTRYVVHYKLEGGGELLQTVRSPSIELVKLKAGTNYTYTIEGYQGTNLVSSYQAPFTTLSNEVPIPQHLTYTIQDDNTLTISWDKNSLYKGYKLVYKDLTGVERTVYPTTNQVKLTGLDPTQSYTYELVGYTKTNESSAPAGGRVATGSTCNLNVEDRNATNWPTISSLEHLLLATGCEGGKLSWLNGTPGTVVNNTITWANGETGQLGGIFLGDHALVVTPQRNTTYTALCQIGSGATQKNCTYSVDVSTPTPTCSSFQIAASKQTFDRGDAIQLTATGCSGQVVWAKGLGTGSSIKFYPRNDFIVYATCLDGTQSCQSNTIPLTLNACNYALFISNSNTSSGKQAAVSVVGCLGGSVLWSYKGNATGKEYTHTDNLTLESRFDYFLTSIQGDIAVTATCTPKGQVACAPVTITVKEPKEECDGKNLDLSDATGSGYPGQWFLTSRYDDTFILTDETGTRINVAPVKQLRIIPGPKDKVYTATFANGCTKTVRVPARIYQIDWQAFNPNSIPGGDLYNAENTTPFLDRREFSLRLRLLDCPGKVEFQSNTQLTPIDASAVYLTTDTQYHPSSTNVYASQAYLPFPNRSTTYSASCQVTNADGTISVYPARNTKTVIVPSDNCMTIDQSEIQVSNGQPVTFTAKGCLGAVVWSSSGLASVTGNTYTVTPHLPLGRVKDIVTYQATCSQPACTQTVSVYVDDCHFLIKASSYKVKIGEEVTITATGCDGGQVEWDTGDVGPQITKKPLTETIYKATCVVNNESTCRPSQATIKVDNQSPGPIDCPQLVLTPDKSKYIRCGDGAVSITASGCQAGSQVTWEGKVTQDISLAYKTTVQQDRTISAVCVTPYKLSSSSQILIHLTDPPLSVAPTTAHAGLPTILRASGCYAANCTEGAYTWTSANTTPKTGSEIKVVLYQDTEFTVTCNGNTSIRQNVSVSEGDCDDRDLPDGLSTFMDATHHDPIILDASWCNTQYTINWQVDESVFDSRKGGWYHVTRDYPEGKNKRTIVVSRPDDFIEPAFGQRVGVTFTYTVYCVPNDATSPYPCPYAAAVFSPALNGTGGTGSEPPTPVGPSLPFDPCSEFIGITKGIASQIERKNVARNPGDVEEITIVPDNAKVYSLATDWCSGTLNWYDDTGSPVTNFQIGVFTSPPKTVFQYQCISNGTTCTGTYSFATDGVSGARVAADSNVPATATTADTPIPAVGTTPPCDQIALSTAAGTLFSTLLCQSMNLMKDDNGQLSQQKILDYLALLKTQIDNYIPDLTFPADLNEVVTALMNGQCEQAGQLLGAANGTKQISVDKFNQVIDAQYGTIQSNMTSNYKDECSQEPAPTLADESTPGGRVAAYTIDPNRYFIAPDGRAVRLPAGATPKFFTFSGQWGLPPAGTLQGFVLADGKTYFAEITKSPQKFLGYRLSTNPMQCPAERFDANLYVTVPAGQKAQAYYFAPIDKTGQCGYTWNEGSYAFERVTNGLVTITPAITGSWQNQTQLKDCPKTGDYIVVGQVNYYHNTGGLSDTEKAQLGSLLAAINGKLGGLIGGKGAVTVVDPDDLDEDALKREGQTKTTTEVQRLRYGNKYVLIFFSGGKLTPCQQAFVDEHIKAFQQSTFFKLAYNDLPGWVNSFYQLTPEQQKYTAESVENGNDIPTYSASPSSEFRKFLLSTAAFYYYAALSVPSCLVDETSFYRASQNPDGSVSYTPVGPENCGKAFAAGAIHSVLEDADVVTMFVGLSEIAKAALSSSVQTWMDYPGNLQSFQQKMETNPEAITAEDLARILPPSIQNEQKAMQQVANMAQFLYKNYYTDANCWRSGELTAQVLPIVLTAGALAATKVAPLLSKVTGRLGRLVQALGSETLAQRLLNNSVEYIEVSANATKKVEQALIKNADDEIQSITEEVEDATGKKTTIKICGFCLAGQTPVFGNGQSIHELAAEQQVQTLERDGSVGWRKLLGKVADRVEGLMRIWVRGDVVSSAPEHDFLTKAGKRPARSLARGMLVYSLLAASWLPIDSVAYVAQPIQVEGLVLGDVVGYGVGHLGLVVSDSRRCPKRVSATNDALNMLEQMYGSRYSEVLDMLDQKQFIPRGSYSLEVRDGKLKLVENSQEWVELLADRFVAQAGTGPNAWNKLLNVDPPLMKNFIYEVDGNFIYETDELGRVKKATIENLQTGTTRVRNETAQQNAKTLKNGLVQAIDGSSDDGGHIAAAQFNGPSEQINYYPMAPSINQPPGAWYNMEQELVGLRAANPTAVIKVEIVPTFGNSSRPGRPDTFFIDVTIDGRPYNLRTPQIPNP